jgi:hypothetical protein
MTALTFEEWHATRSLPNSPELEQVIFKWHNASSHPIHGQPYVIGFRCAWSGEPLSEQQEREIKTNSVMRAGLLGGTHARKLLKAGKIRIDDIPMAMRLPEDLGDVILWGEGDLRNPTWVTPKTLARRDAAMAAESKVRRDRANSVFDMLASAAKYIAGK